MLEERPRHSIALKGVFAAVAVALCASAAELDRPIASSVAELRKAPPSQGPRDELSERFAQIVKERYPQLVNQGLDGTPVLNVLFNEDGTVAHTDYEVVDGEPGSAITPFYYATRFHMAANEVAYMGLRRIVSPSTGEIVLIAFTERKKPNQPYTSKVFHTRDTRAIDRSLVQRYFPGELKRGVSDQERLWVLFDHGGHVVVTGKDSSGSSAGFSGIEAQFITVTPVTDDRSQPLNTLSGKPLRLYSLWLKK